MTETSGTNDSETLIMHSAGCGCIGCSGSNRDYELSDPDNANEQSATTTTSAPSTAATKEDFADYLTEGFWHDIYASYGGVWASGDYEGWTQSSITYSIENSYSAAEQDGIELAFQLWSDVTNLTFTEVSSGGDISIEAPANLSEQNRAFASNSITSSDGSTVTINGARIVMDFDSGYFGSDPTDFGDYALTTTIHEIGHALGLGHTGNYNAGNGNPTYNNDAQWTNDTRQYSLMSYWSASNSGSSVSEYPSSPMLMDIYAIQTLYGADTSTRSGNTTYGFNSTANRDIYDFDINDNPVLAIWDGGGTDTLDVSGYSQNQVITLVSGDFSNIGGSTGNISIAYNAVIENAIGGSGDDSIYGNSANNTLEGNAGDDTFYGSAGSDNIDGDGDNDSVVYTYDISAFLVSLVNSASLTLQHISDGWTDTITNVESFIFNGSTYSFDAVADTASGMGDVTLKWIWSGGSDTINYNNNGTDTYTAAEIGYSAQSGNMFSVNRTNTNMSIEILDANAPGDLRITSRNGDNDFSITGVNNGLSIFLAGSDDDDEITISAGIIGDDDLRGGDGDDTLYASDGDDKIQGDAGDDYLNGGDGDDRLWGGADDDTIYGGDGADTIFGEAGTDTINSGAGADLIYGDNGHTSGGNDVINSGAGEDIVHGRFGDDTINGGDNYDKLYGGADNDTIYGGNGNDRLYGEDGNDELYGGSGNDLIYGDAGTDTITGGAGEDRIYGGDDIDTIDGGDDYDRIYGEGGNDNLSGGNGDDKLWGGAGNDDLNGGADNDILHGDAGVDTINGGNGADTIYGGDDGDTLNGGDGIDSIYGDDGNDVINGGNDGDYLRGGIGNDTINGDAGADDLRGGSGIDTINGGAGADYIRGESGADILNGGTGADTIYGDDDGDTIHGDDDNDNLYGQNGDDTLYGDAGTDYLYGGNNNDTLYGGTGRDYLRGDAGNDILNGGASNDDLRGGSGIDTINGDDGADYIKGEGGDDTINGGSGRDTLYGGAGSDTFVYNASDVDGFDKIWDFEDGVGGDVIDLSDLLSAYDSLSDNINDFVRSYAHTSNGTVIQVDLDGAGSTYSFSSVTWLRNVGFTGDVDNMIADGNLTV